MPPLMKNPSRSATTHTEAGATAQPSMPRMMKHWKHLCLRIGDRRAGSSGEQTAAEYLLDEFRKAGLASVHAEPFPCRSVVRSRAEISVGNKGRFRRVPARVLAGSPSTPEEKQVEGELVWIEMPEQAERLLQPSLRGKVVVLFGPLPTRADWHRRLVAARPAAVMHVDDRLPFDWVKDDGVYPTWVERYRSMPAYGGGAVSSRMGF